MKTNIVIIHGAGSRAYPLTSSKWVPLLHKNFPGNFNIVCPAMPNPNYPQYASWKAVIIQTLKELQGPVILIGHSLGGTVLLKYVLEEKVTADIQGLFIVASPYFSLDKGWPYEDFMIRKIPGNARPKIPIYSYHSSDDPIVPINHQGHIADSFPQTLVRSLSGHGHEFSRKEFKEILDDIKKLIHFGTDIRLDSI